MCLRGAQETGVAAERSGMMIELSRTRAASTRSLAPCFLVVRAIPHHMPFSRATHSSKPHGNSKNCLCGSLEVQL